MDWTTKYRPGHLREVVGNSPALQQMLAWAQTWTRQSRPLIIYGKPGTGKTSSAYALASDLNWEIIELNASDQRTRAVIERVVGSSSTTASLSGAKRKLILLDEADNLQGNADKGGAKAIIDAIKNSRQPILLIANDLYDLPQELRSRCELIQFRALPARSITPRLRYICSAEGVSCSDGAIKEISEAAAGDMRSAITMLYAASIGRDAVGEREVQTSRKDERSSIFDLISTMFKPATASDLLKTAYEIDETPDTLEQWIEANLIHLQRNEDLAAAYRHLSRADEYIGLTYRQQYHILWRYATALMILGVAQTSTGQGIHARITTPERWKKMGTYRKQKGVRTGLLRKMSAELHISQNTLREDYFTPLALLFDAAPAEYAREYALDADELNLLVHDKARTQKVMKILAEEEDRAKKERERSEKEATKKKKVPVEPLQPEIQTQAHAGRPADTKPDPEEQKNQKTLFDGF